MPRDEQPQGGNTSVVFLGKLGHGKTHLLNKLCGTSFTSIMCAESCTRQNQVASTLRYGIKIIDTPGFGSSDDTDTHIREQRAAIEGERISGIYTVVKYSSPSEMAANLNHLMNFAGVDDVRVIVTHVDIGADQNDKFDGKAVIAEISSQQDIEETHIFLSGKATTGSEIEEFLWSTLHKPRKFKLETEQVAYASSLTVGARQFNTDVQQAVRKLEQAEEVVKKLSISLGGQGTRRVNVELAIEAIHTAATNATNKTRQDILKRATELTPEQRRAVEEKTRSWSIDLMR
jgi:GTP-binding protein EngB required for normal cell division